jgi:hypothetical protein
MDEVLVALHPTRNAADFAAAATLHRELEEIEAAISALRHQLEATPTRSGRR